MDCLFFLFNNFLLENESPSGICWDGDCVPQSHTSTSGFLSSAWSYYLVERWTLLYLHTQSWQLLPWGSSVSLAVTLHLLPCPIPLSSLLVILHTLPEIPIASQVCPLVPVP